VDCRRHCLLMQPPADAAGAGGHSRGWGESIADGWGSNDNQALDELP